MVLLQDVASIRDAAIALAQMVKRPYLRDRCASPWPCAQNAALSRLIYDKVTTFPCRFMQAPTGLGRVFELLQCSNVSLKSTALQVGHVEASKRMLQLTLQTDSLLAALKWTVAYLCFVLLSFFCASATAPPMHHRAVPAGSHQGQAQRVAKGA